MGDHASRGVHRPRAATVEGTEGELAIAGPGAPLVAEFCVAELALVLEMSTDAGAPTSATPSRSATGSRSSGRRSPPVGCRCGRPARSPRPPRPCAAEGAAHVDTPPRAPGAPAARTRRSTAPSRTPCAASTPTRPRSDAAQAADARHFDVDLDQVSFDGTVHVDAELDLADALDLNDAITAGAARARRPRVRRSPSTSAARWPPVPWPAASSPSTSQADPPGRPATGASGS